MCQVILWGAVLLCHAPVQDFSGLAAARTFLGVFEASIQVRKLMDFDKHSEPSHRLQPVFNWPHMKCRLSRSFKSCCGHLVLLCSPTSIH